MTPEELLRRYPRETLRGRLGLTQARLAEWVGVEPQVATAWEARLRRDQPRQSPPPDRAALAAASYDGGGGIRAVARAGLGD